MAKNWRLTHSCHVLCKHKHEPKAYFNFWDLRGTCQILAKHWRQFFQKTEQIRITFTWKSRTCHWREGNYPLLYPRATPLTYTHASVYSSMPNIAYRFKCTHCKLHDCPLNQEESSEEHTGLEYSLILIEKFLTRARTHKNSHQLRETL